MSDWWSADPIAGGSTPQTSALAPAHRDLAIRTIYGEAANEPDEGQAAVAAVIKNRMQAGRYGGDSIPGVVLAKNQFEPWGNTDARSRMMALKQDDPRYQKIGGIVDQMFGGQMEDPTGGATHFVAPAAQAALGRPMPSWAQGEGQAIGRHTFFAPEGRVQQPGNWWSNDPMAGQPQQPAPVQHNTEGLSDRVAREGLSPQVPQISGPGAFMTGVKQGASANFSDELSGAYAAGSPVMGLPEGARPRVFGMDFATPAIGAARVGYDYLTGKRGDATKTYEDARDKAREEIKAAEAQHPGLTLAGNLAGGVAVPLGRAAQGATLAQRAAQGAKVGAVYGSASGVGAGEDTTGRVIGGVVGGGLGGILGAAAPVAIEGAVRGARSAAAPIANAIRGIRDPEGEAARRVTLSVQRDITADPAASSRLTPAEFAASYQSGGPATIMDIGGETTRALARSASNTSPEGRQILNQSINDRFEGQAGRVTNWLNDTFNFPNVNAQQQAIDHLASTVNKPAYARAYQQGDKPIWSPELQRLVGSPDVVAAMKNAAEKGKSRAIVDGFGGFNSSVQISPSGVVQFTSGKNGVPTYPNLQFWDYTKRALDDQAKSLARAGNDSQAGVVKQLAFKLRSELDSHVPNYAQARAGAAHFFGAENALEAGQNFVAQNFQNAAARQQLAKMSPLERQLFQDGFVSRYIDTLNKVGDRRSVLNQVASSPAAREKLDIALGPQRAKELEAGLRTEGIMDLARKAVQGNSTTARQLTELGLAGGTYSLGTGFDVLNPNPSALMSAALVYGAARGRGVINENVSRKVAEMLVSNDPRKLLQGVKIVARNENILSSLRKFDATLSKGGAQQVPASVPALQAPMALRADQEQQ